jgi:hypothetical protein
MKTLGTILLAALTCLTGNAMAFWTLYDASHDDE